MALRWNKWVAEAFVVAIATEPSGIGTTKPFVLAGADLGSNVLEWSGFFRPIIRRGHSLRPSVSPDG